MKDRKMGKSHEIRVSRQQNDRNIPCLTFKFTETLTSMPRYSDANEAASWFHGVNRPRTTVRRKGISTKWTNFSRWHTQATLRIFGEHLRTKEISLRASNCPIKDK